MSHMTRQKLEVSRSRDRTQEGEREGEGELRTRAGFLRSKNFFLAGFEAAADLFLLLVMENIVAAESGSLMRCRCVEDLEIEVKRW